MTPLRLVFMGSPRFALPTLDALAAAGHEIARVYSQPPSRAGRGHMERPSPVHARAEEMGLEVRTPATLEGEDEGSAFEAVGADAAVVAAYGLMLPDAILARPRLGCLNVHASLLPRWRGAAPVERAIMAGDAETGVTIMRVTKALDSGPIVLAERVPIADDATGGALSEALAQIGARLMVEALDGVQAGTLTPAPQAADGVTYAAKIAPADRRLDWSEPAAALERRVRALAPKPGAWLWAAGERVKVLAAAVEADATGPAGGAEPGAVVDDALGIACAEGVLRPTRVQRAGRTEQDTAAFLRGFPVAPGTRLDRGPGGG